MDDGPDTAATAMSHDHDVADAKRQDGEFKRGAGGVVAAIGRVGRH